MHMQTPNSVRTVSKGLGYIVLFGEDTLWMFCGCIQETFSYLHVWCGAVW